MTRSTARKGAALDEIAAAGWTMLLDHADSIGFFTRPEPQRPAPDARIFHVTIKSSGRSRELAINDRSRRRSLPSSFV